MSSKQAIYFLGFMCVFITVILITLIIEKDKQLIECFGEVYIGQVRAIVEGKHLTSINRDGDIFILPLLELYIPSKQQTKFVVAEQNQIYRQCKIGKQLDFILSEHKIYSTLNTATLLNGEKND